MRFTFDGQILNASAKRSANRALFRSFAIGQNSENSSFGCPAYDTCTISSRAAQASPANNNNLAFHGKLDNGLEVVVVPDTRAPVVTHMVWYRVGAADEPQGKSGIAHFLEHLMFKGTEKVPPGEFSKIVARLGGQDNAFTSQDITSYFQRVAKEKLAK